MQSMVPLSFKVYSKFESSVNYEKFKKTLQAFVCLGEIMKASVFLKQKRVGAKLSQKDVSTELGYGTPQFVSNWERGVSSPPIGTLKKIARIYGTNDQDLFEVCLKDSMERMRNSMFKKFARMK